KGSRVPSFLMTRGIRSSATSKVVKRSLQDRHSRRRRTWPPSATRRESITLVSSAPQKGQCMTEIPWSQQVGHGSTGTKKPCTGEVQGFLPRLNGRRGSGGRGQPPGRAPGESPARCCPFRGHRARR